ncbi:cell division protein FtsQ/DivIB [Lederbergia citrea]|uniref:Cell division protein DivIB n=1 Tax=Lederbergia citrea TaxID=2833581 RepID=A0A942UHH1_9BACI|nr:FtsQ-type POTRA domain-containing protein [Lederbergia citrea]MBS4177207.1 FtsQ-type POTRA domain-containing protein [Lederbergia citrea]MBS4203870.1 FtsQ-type POTRA domain-containing protein [Lederbergia citrea]MBS4221545.1 FtsQ-type POTRA domain-containing protein [Lederbergia citrea]
MQKGKVLSLEDRIPKIKEHRKRKANRRLIILLSLFFLLIACVVYFQSPLSQIKKIDVLGNATVTIDEVLSASGLKAGNNIWKIDKAKAEENLLALPEIKSAKIKIGFPNKVVIKLKEYPAIAFMNSENHFYPILENGVILKKNKGAYVNAPILTNFKKGVILEELAGQLKQFSPEILNAISEIHYDPKKTDKYHIYLFMNDGFEVNATIPTLASKMVHYPSIISQLDPNVKGVIDLEVGSFFRAYKNEGEKKDEEEDER